MRTSGGHLRKGGLSAVWLSKTPWRRFFSFSALVRADFALDNIVLGRDIRPDSLEVLAKEIVIGSKTIPLVVIRAKKGDGGPSVNRVSGVVTSNPHAGQHACISDCGITKSAKTMPEFRENTVRTIWRAHNTVQTFAIDGGCELDCVCGAEYGYSRIN